MWTHFMDMHSGGGRKLQWENVFINAPKAEAIAIFEKRFDRDPYNITCDCCGEDYAVDEYPTLEAAANYWIQSARCKNLEEFLKLDHVLVIDEEKKARKGKP